MADTVIPNQFNFQDGQNFELDVDKVYSDFIKAIDKVRSYHNTNEIREKSIGPALKDVSTLPDAREALVKKCTLESSPQESRCHAFFRIIGFPCSDSSKSKIFNPGLDKILSENRVIDDEYKIGVMKDPIPKFRDLSVVRETYILDLLNIFSAPESIDAGALALSSGRNTRPFISSLKNVTFDDMSPASQQYKMDFSSSVGGIPKSLVNYQDVDGNPPKKLPAVKFGHYIKPFLVDPIIDLTVNDSSKLIAVPFVTSKDQLRVKLPNISTSFVSRPILEQVIRDRFTITNPAETSGTADKSVLDYIKKVPGITDIGIVKKTAGSIYKLNDQDQFIKFFYIIRSMVKKLYAAKQDLIKAQEIHYWVPVPSLIGPEGGSEVGDFFFSDKMSTDLITSQDKGIIEAFIQQIIDQTDANAANAKSEPDVGGFGLPTSLGIPNLGGSTTPDALGNVTTKNLKALKAQREGILSTANSALRTIEIIMGEFSGLGLCDIVAILGGLYLMPKESLLGFLDKDALARMNAVGLKGSESSLTTASNDLISVVKDFYNLMDKLYEDVSQNNGDI